MSASSFSASSMGFPFLLVYMAKSTTYGKKTPKRIQHFAIMCKYISVKTTVINKQSCRSIAEYNKQLQRKDFVLAGLVHSWNQLYHLHLSPCSCSTPSILHFKTSTSFASILPSFIVLKGTSQAPSKISELIGLQACITLTKTVLDCRRNLDIWK